MTHVHDPHTTAPRTDLDVYRLRIQLPTRHLLLKTLRDQIRPGEAKIRNMEAGSGQLAFDATLTPDEVTFIKLLYPSLQMDWLCEWSEENRRLLR